MTRRRSTIAMVSLGRFLNRFGGLTRFQIIAIIMAIAVTISPLGMVGMAETHAMTMDHAQTAMAPAHCAAQTDGDNRNPFENAADCIAACTGVAVCLPVLIIELTRTIEMPGQSIVATPHEQSPGFEPPPPRTS